MVYALAFRELWKAKTAKNFVIDRDAFIEGHTEQVVQPSPARRVAAHLKPTIDHAHHDGCLEAAAMLLELGHVVINLATGKRPGLGKLAGLTIKDRSTKETARPFDGHHATAEKVGPVAFVLLPHVQPVTEHRFPCNSVS